MIKVSELFYEFIHFHDPLQIILSFLAFSAIVRIKASILYATKQFIKETHSKIQKKEVYIYNIERDKLKFELRSG